MTNQNDKEKDIDLGHCYEYEYDGKNFGDTNFCFCLETFYLVDLDRNKENLFALLICAKTKYNLHRASINYLISQIEID